MSWTKEMQAYLAENRLWFIVNGIITEPKLGEEQVTYMEKSAQAAGAMFFTVEVLQHVHFNRIEMDGPAIWAKLQSTRLQKVSGARYNALDAVFNIRKQPDKSLPSLASRVDTLVQSFKDLCPGGYTLEQLKGISAMSILQSLLQEYDSFTSGLIQQDATKSEIVQAFVRKHQTRSGCQDGSASPDNVAMHAAALQVNKADLLCDFCKMKGHDKEHCFAKRDAHVVCVTLLSAGLWWVDNTQEQAGEHSV
jgi:hypothetical protein